MLRKHAFSKIALRMTFKVLMTDAKSRSTSRIIPGDRTILELVAYLENIGIKVHCVYRRSRVFYFAESPDKVLF